MGHSLLDYLNRQSTAELKAAIQYCLRQNDALHMYYITLIVEILEKRAKLSDQENEHRQS